MKITWMSQGSFLVESKGTRFLIDPYMSDCLESKGLKRMVKYPLTFDELKLDVLICSHDHLDHLDPETVCRIAELYPDCTFAGPISCCNHYSELGVSKGNQVLMTRGESIQLSNITVIPVFAEHSDPEAIGIVIKAEGKKVYISSDTLYNDKLFSKHTENCDLTLICINGRLGNMSLDDALKFVKKAKPKTALPMHYGLFAENTADPKPFVEGCKESGINSFEMELGKEFSI